MEHKKKYHFINYVQNQKVWEIAEIISWESVGQSIYDEWMNESIN